jgi:hypothetical protein
VGEEVVVVVLLLDDSLLGEALVLTVVFVSVFSVVAGDAEGFTTVVLFSVLLSAGGLVSDFCSHAANNAAPASRQMYFFIDMEVQCGLTQESEQASFSALLMVLIDLFRAECKQKHENRSQKGAVNWRPCASATAWMVSLPSRVLTPPARAGCFLQAPSRPRSASNST